MANVNHRNSNSIKVFLKKISLICILLINAKLAFAQTGSTAPATNSSNTEDIDIIEAEMNKSQSSKKDTTPDKDFFDEKKIDFAGLARLSSFKDVAIIQKRFLPKTNRFQFNLGLNTITNNAWFLIGGYDVRLSFFFNETWGIEGNYWGVSTSEKQLTKDMNSIQGIKTASLLFPKAYSGIDIVYVPFYGKMSWIDRRIVPFDLYFSAGLGKTTTNYDGQLSNTFHVATGQIFAITKSWAFRWDFSLNNYVAKGLVLQDTTDTSAPQEVSQAINDLYLNIGLSWFFPGAKYR